MADFSALVEGYRRFRESGWVAQRERWAELAEGQSPKVMVIACSDSRVDPAQIFDARPGRDLRRAQRRQSGPPVRAARRPSRRLGGARIRRHAARSRGYRRHGARVVRRLRGGADRTVRRRADEWRRPLHRPLDGAARRRTRRCSPAMARGTTAPPSGRWSTRRSGSASRICAAFPGSGTAKRVADSAAWRLFSISEGVLHLLDEADRRLQSDVTRADPAA